MNEHEFYITAKELAHLYKSEKIDSKAFADRIVELSENVKNEVKVKAEIKSDILSSRKPNVIYNKSLESEE